MSADSVLFLWGIDGDLRGNEKLLVSAWPFVRLTSDSSEVIATRGASWNIEIQTAVQRLESEEIAGERGTRLHAASAVQVQQGDIIGLIGPALFEDLCFLSIEIDQFGHAWLNVQDGFRVSPMRLSRWHEFTRHISNESKRLFDSELINIGVGAESSRRMSAALRLLRGSPATKLDEQVIRTAAYAKLSKDSDTLRRVLDSATDRLNCTTSEITAWVDDYIEMFSGSSAAVVVNTALAPIQRLALKPFQEYRFPGEPSRATVALVFKRMLADVCKNFVNGSDERAVGDGLGLFLADEEPKPLRFDNPWFWNIWGGLTDAVEVLASPRARKMQMHVLQTRTAALSRALKPTLGKSLGDHIRLQSVVLSKARAVTAAAGKAQIARLRVGESQFPEERLFSSVAEEALNETDGIVLDKNPISYRNLEIAHGREADFALINELLLNSAQLKRSVGIFEHGGYFGFASRTHLVSLIENLSRRPLPLAVIELIHGILSATSSFDEGSHTEGPGVRSADDLSARCWVLVDAGVRVYEESEYRVIYRGMVEKALRLRAPDLSASENRSDSFEADFEAFVEGTSNVFMGGSIHARLLMRGWSRYGNRFVTLLEPHHVQAILGRWPLANRLVFGSRLQSRAALREALQNLYLSVGGVLDRIAVDAQRQVSASNGALHHLMTTLSPGRPSNPEARWSFVAHEQDMVDLLRVDNHLNQQLQTPSRGRTRPVGGSRGKPRR